MDLKEIRSRLDSMQSKSSGGNKKDNHKWKPPIGKSSIRVVPNKLDKNYPFTEVKVYYGIGKKVMISPLVFGKKDPIVELTQKLREGNDKENWRLAKKLDPKMRIFLPIIVRGEEDKGVQLWEFGKELYMDFLNLADNEDVGDYTDVAEGRDIIVTTVGPETTGTDYNKSSIMPRTKQTPLSEDKNLVKKWLEDQPNPLDNYTKYSFEEMKSALQSFLSPEESEESDSDIDKSENPFEEEMGKTSKSSNVSNYSKNLTKTSNEEKFNNLFDDEN